VSPAPSRNAFNLRLISLIEVWVSNIRETRSG